MLTKEKKYSRNEM